MENYNYEKVKEYITHNKFPEALSILIEEKRKNDKDWNVNYLIGFCYRALNNFEESIRHYLIAVNLNPKDSSTSLGLGIAYQLNENYSEAIRYLNRAIELNSNNVEAVNSLGLTYAKIGNYHKAIEEYNKAIKVLVDSLFSYIKNNNPEIIGSSKDGKTFEVNPAYFKEMKKLLCSNILYSTLKNNIGVCYAELEQYQEAKECYLESIEHIPIGVNYEPPKIGLEKLLSIS